MNNSNICPKCGSELVFSKWFITEKLYKIDDRGKVSKRSYKIISLGAYEPECGVICSNFECDYTTVGSGRVG